MENLFAIKTRGNLLRNLLQYVEESRECVELCSGVNAEEVQKYESYA